MTRFLLCIMMATTLYVWAPEHKPLIIWEPGQTVFSFQEEQMIKHLSFTQIYWNLGFFTGSDALGKASYHQYKGTSMRKEILHALNTNAIPTRWNPHYLEQPVPPVMQEWLLGKKGHEEATKESWQTLTNNYNQLQEHTRNLLPYVLPLIFNPQTITSAFIPNETTINLVQRLRQQGIPNVAVSNVNNEALKELQQDPDKQKAINVFDDIHTSHDVGILKPDPTIIQKVAQHYDTRQDSCILVEPEPHHHYTFIHNGLRSILYNNPDQVEKDINEAINSQ